MHFYELRTCNVQINVHVHRVQVINDGHGPSYVLSTSKGYFIITDAPLTTFDLNEYKIIKIETNNDINSCYGVYNDTYFRKDTRKNGCTICYSGVMAKDTCKYNTIMNNIIVTSHDSMRE